MPTARKLPSGSWRCQVFSHYEEVDGKKKRIYKSFTSDDPTRAGKKACEAAAAEFSWLRKEQKHKDLTFGDAVDQYILYREAVLSPTTITEYKRIRKKCCQALMLIRIGEITQEMIQEEINFLAHDASAKTVRNIHGLISAVLRVYRPDFALRTVLPKKVRPGLYVPSDDDIAKLIAFCDGGEMELPILLAAFGPMRRGEISALHTDNISGNIVHVCRNMVITENKEWIIRQPKTYSSDRFIEYPDFVAKKWKGLDGYITKLNPNAITHRFCHLLKNAGLPHFRFHDLRHYSASIQHALGIPDSYIMQRGGWSNDGTLKAVYRHTLENETKKMNDIANKHFSDLMQHEMQHESSRNQ